MSAKRPILTLNRDYVLVTTKGHVIAFKKDEPIDVPQAVVADALAVGAMPADKEAVKVLEDAKEEKAPLTLEEREEAILKVIPGMLEANVRESFTAAGTPHAKAVSELVGFKTSAKEVSAVWDKYNATK